MISPSVAAVATTSTAVVAAKRAAQHEAATRAQGTTEAIGGSSVVRINCALAARAPAWAAPNSIGHGKESGPHRIGMLMETCFKTCATCACGLMHIAPSAGATGAHMALGALGGDRGIVARCPERVGDPLVHPPRSFCGG